MTKLIRSFGPLSLCLYFLQSYSAYQYISCDKDDEKHDVYVNLNAVIECREKDGIIDEYMTKCIIKDIGNEEYEYIDKDAVAGLLEKPAFASLADDTSEEVCNKLLTVSNYNRIRTIVVGNGKQVERETFQQALQGKPGGSTFRRWTKNDEVVQYSLPKDTENSRRDDSDSEHHVNCVSYQPDQTRFVYINRNAWLECQPSRNRIYEERLTRCIVQENADRHEYRYIDSDSMNRLSQNRAFQLSHNLSPADCCNQLTKIDGYYDRIVSQLGTSKIHTERLSHLLDSPSRINIKRYDGQKVFEYNNGDNLYNKRIRCNNPSERQSVYINVNAWIECQKRDHDTEYVEYLAKCIIRDDGNNFEYVDLDGLGRLIENRKFSHLGDEHQEDMCNMLVEMPDHYNKVVSVLGRNKIYETTFSQARRDRDNAEILRWNGYKLLEVYNIAEDSWARRYETTTFDWTVISDPLAQSLQGLDLCSTLGLFCPIN